MNTNTATSLPPSIIPRLMSRSEAFERCAALAEEITKLSERWAQSAVVWEAGALIIDTTKLSGLDLKGQSHGVSALILCLPPVFEPSLMQLVAQAPTLKPQHSLDLLQRMLLATWQVESGESVCIQSDVLECVVDCCAPYDTRTWKRLKKSVPVLMLAGDSVAIGGFWIDDAWDENLATQQQAVQATYKPREAYDEKTLEMAAAQARLWGRFPWEHDVWLDDDGYMTIAPPTWYFSY